jgi:hypothetical protein
MDAAREWIDGLGVDLAVQARLAGRLLDAVEVDVRWDWLEVGCSVAQGRGDSLSDLDVGLGHQGERPAPEDVDRMLRGLGDVVDLTVSPWNGVPRWWVQYEDGGQLDILVLPATSRNGRAPGSVALVDRSGRLADTFVPTSIEASTTEVRIWLVDGWEALSHVAKCLRLATAGRHADPRLHSPLQEFVAARLESL